MPVNNKKIFCIIPAYNEEQTIARVIQGVKPLVDRVVIVDDGSADKTRALAGQQEAVVLGHMINRGQGAALQTGNEYALASGADIIIHFDADGQFVAEEINDLIMPLLDEGYDLVLGSRFLKKSSVLPKFKKYFILPIARFVNIIFLNVNLTDPQNGLRALTAKTARRINITQDGMAHCSEILAQAVKLNLKIKEIPSTVIYHNFGQKFGGGIKILKDMLFARLLN